MAIQQTVVLTFQDPSGNPLANGEVVITLQWDISAGVSGGPSVGAGRTVTASLDATGKASVLLWPNDTTEPSGSSYLVQAYSAAGELAWSDQMTVSSS